MLSETMPSLYCSFLKFTQLMRGFKDLVNVPEDVKSHIRTIEKRFCIVSPLFNRFERYRFLKLAFLLLMCVMKITFNLKN